VRCHCLLVTTDAAAAAAAYILSRRANGVEVMRCLHDVNAVDGWKAERRPSCAVGYDKQDSWISWRVN